MAKTLSAFSSLHTGYPWDRWTNGEPWEVQHKKDFTAEPAMFRHTLYSKARRDKRKVRVSLIGKIVRFQFYAPTRRKAKASR